VEAAKVREVKAKGRAKVNSFIPNPSRLPELMLSEWGAGEDRGFDGSYMVFSFLFYDELIKSVEQSTVDVKQHRSS
jgi:hypothetical protein